MFSLWLHDFLEDEFKFWEIVDRKSGRGGKKKKKKSQQMKTKKKKKKKIFQQHWADIRKLRSVLKRRNHKPEKLRSRQEGLFFSRVHNPREALQQHMNEPQRSACLGEKFFFQLALRLSPHTTARGGGADILPGAAPLMSAATWAPGSGDAVSLRPCVSKAAAAKWRQYRPHVDTWGTCNICAPLYYHIRNYTSIMFTMTFC